MRKLVTKAQKSLSNQRGDGLGQVIIAILIVVVVVAIALGGVKPIATQTKTTFNQEQSELNGQAGGTNPANTSNLTSGISH